MPNGAILLCIMPLFLFFVRLVGEFQTALIRNGFFITVMFCVAEVRSVKQQSC
ncbi:hypothetical protein BN1221_02684 [Brenneria goodwinii]|uniref:Uncharacterized protein n=1 Tax=Brenneria goodwinii TaxID=1109412 RepID=A0A0G4JX13_9GAMM|nr:hypothetical protein BN1221_02684 [Brenneria goodwinii]